MIPNIFVLCEEIKLHTEDFIVDFNNIANIFNNNI